MLKRALAYILILSTIMPSRFVFAADLPTAGSKIPAEEGQKSAGMEYKVGSYQGAVLMNVQLWGAVTKTGSFDLPSRSDLATLISYAGGPLKDAELDNVTIRRTSKGRPQLIKVDLEKLFERPDSQAPILEPNDVVMIPTHKPFIDPDFAQTAGIVSVLLTVVISSILISNQLNK